MLHVATPVVGSTSRKLGQPLVPQKRREPVVAAEVRRRMRRMELARPAKVVVVERDIMVAITLGAFWRATGDLVPGPRPLVCCFALDSPRWGPERSW
jgi:hypothetical protein